MLLSFLFGVLLLSLLNIELWLVFLLELVVHHVFLGDQQVGSFLVIELGHKLIICFSKVLGAFDRIFAGLEALPIFIDIFIIYRVVVIVILRMVRILTVIVKLLQVIWNSMHEVVLHGWWTAPG